MSQLGKLIRQAADESVAKGHSVKFTVYHLGVRGVCKVCQGHTRISETSNTIFGIITSDRCKGASNDKTRSV